MVINFFGRRGSGKTTTIKGNLAYYKRPVLIVDVLGNFDDDDEIIQTQSIGHAINEFAKQKANSNESRPISLRTSDPQLAAEYFSSAIWKGRGGTLVLDEVDTIRYKDGSCFDEYIRYGRNRGGDLITGCRRPAELDRNITAAANKFYCFSTHEPRDIEYFSDTLFGDEAWTLRNMPQFSGLFIDYDNKRKGTFHIDPEGNIYHDQEVTF